MTLGLFIKGLRILRIKSHGAGAAMAAIVAILSLVAPAAADNLGWIGGTTEVNIVTPGVNNYMYAYSGGIGSMTDNPFTFNGGNNFVYIGRYPATSGSGKVLLDSIWGDNNTLQSIRIGHNNADVFLNAGGPALNGNGELRVEGATPLNTKWGSGSPSGQGDFLVGGASGNNGTVTWNSTGTLTAGGAFRIGQGGRGTFHQNAGKVVAGRDPNGSGVFAAVANAGSTVASPSTYNLNNGTFEVGAALDTPTSGIQQEIRRNFRVGANDTGVGVFNLGDGTGAPGSALMRTWDDITIGYHNPATTAPTAVGTINIRSDGRLEQNFATVAKAAGIGGADAPFVINNGTVNHLGGVLDTDGVLQFGKDTVTANAASYLITGSAGSLNVRALDIGAKGTLGFTFDASGVMKMTVEGSTNIAGDTAIGITLAAGATLNLASLSTYASNSTVTLIDSLDPAVIPTGTFTGFAQGQAVGMNSLGTQFYINYTGGTGNDVVLQTTVPGATGDFDADGDVDGADFMAWQIGFGTGTGATRGQGDSNTDGDVDADDLGVWKAQFVPAATANVGAVPEPTGIAGVLIALTAVAGVSRRRASR